MAIALLADRAGNVAFAQLKAPGLRAELARGINDVVATDDKTVRGSKQNKVLNIKFRKDACRIRKDHSARNLATIRRAVLNMLRREPSNVSLKRKRLKAALNPAFRAPSLLTLTIDD